MKGDTVWVVNDTGSIGVDGVSVYTEKADALAEFRTLKELIEIDGFPVKIKELNNGGLVGIVGGSDESYTTFARFISCTQQIIR